MTHYDLQLKINQIDYSLTVGPYESLNRVIRERLGLTGTKKGCDYGGCGSCTVLVDGRPVYSCMYPALRAEGKEVTTVEGLAKGDDLDPLQEAFVNYGGLQCGYCTPGFLMSARALLDRIAQPSDRDIRYALSGNLCRCTGYQKIFRAVKAASEKANVGSTP